MIKIFLACVISIFAATSAASAWWNPFQQPAPEVTVTYDDIQCTGTGKIYTLIRNTGTEPLASYEIEVSIFPKGYSSAISSIEYGSEKIIEPGQVSAICLDISRIDVGNWVSFTNPNLTIFEQMEAPNYPTREFLADAIFRPQVIRFQHGLPY